MFRVCFVAGMACFLTLSSVSSAQTGAPVPPAKATSAAPATESPVSVEPVAERFDTLGLEGSHLEAQRPLVGETDELPEFTREYVRLQWRPGDPVDIYVIKPAHLKNPPVILYLYGFPTEADRFRNNDYCKTLTKGGFAAVGFVSALTGERYHDRPMKEWFVSELQESLTSSVHDVHMLLDYLASRGDLDMKHVGMFGQGSGGTIALLAAATDPRIKAVDAIDPWGDWPDWLQHSPRIPEEERKDYLTPAFESKVTNLDPVVWLPKLGGRDLRLEETAFDFATPKEAKLRMKSVLPASAKYVRYESVEDYKLHAASGGQILFWLDSELSPARDAINQSSLSTSH
jgi:acetyl esterase/lipase